MRIPGVGVGRRRRGDLLAVCRERLGKLGLRIRDTRPVVERGPSRRRSKDVALQAMLAVVSGAELGLPEGVAGDAGLCAAARVRAFNALPLASGLCFPRSD